MTTQEHMERMEIFRKGFYAFLSQPKSDGTYWPADHRAANDCFEHMEHEYYEMLGTMKAELLTIQVSSMS